MQEVRKEIPLFGVSAGRGRSLDGTMWKPISDSRLGSEQRGCEPVGLLMRSFLQCPGDGHHQAQMAPTLVTNTCMFNRIEPCATLRVCVSFH